MLKLPVDDRRQRRTVARPLLRAPDFYFRYALEVGDVALEAGRVEQG